MGTRHITAVFVDGAFRIAQYGQWDGYPSGQGVKILRFLRGTNHDEFRRKACLTVELDDEAFEKLEADIKDLGQNYDYIDALKLFGFAHLSRDVGSEILSVLMLAPDGLKVQNNIEFASDGLFCEWLWLIDLDKNVLEVYEGFHKGALPPGERFASFNTIGTVAPGGYSAVKFKYAWPLDALPPEDEFLAILEPQEAEA